MAEKQWRAKNLEEVKLVAAELISAMQASTVLFDGAMGAGKTTLIKALCEVLGVQDQVSSPTFSLVNEYLAANDQKVFHFDWYRIEEEEEAWAIGLEEYIAEGDWLFMEWPEKISNLLPLEYYLIRISSDEEGIRTISLNKVHE